MTREQLINSITKDVATEFRFNDLTEIISSGAIEFAINKLCDDFESRSCDGCKWDDLPFPDNSCHCDECKHQYSDYNDNWEKKDDYRL